MTMKKLLLGTVLLSFMYAGAAKADFEAVETTLGQLENIQKEAQNVQEKLKEVEAKLNALRQGDFGPLSDVVSKIPNDIKVDVKMLGPMAEKAGDSAGMEEAVEENLIPQYTNKNQDETYIAYQKTIEATRRENLSRLYAYALTLRTNMEKTRRENKSDDEPVTTEDSREILQSAVTKEAMENARRVAHIWDMQSGVYELYLMQISQQLSNTTDEETEGEEQ